MLAPEANEPTTKSRPSIRDFDTVESAAILVVDTQSSLGQTHQKAHEQHRPDILIQRLAGHSQPILHSLLLPHPQHQRHHMKEHIVLHAYLADGHQFLEEFKSARRVVDQGTAIGLDDA